MVTAAIALGGGGIWTMHFIGMLAYQVPMDVGYAPGLTFLSLVVAVAVVGIGLSIVVSGRVSLIRLVSAGVFTGLGVASMHYMGMAAMVMPGEMYYNNVLVGLSILIAVVAATVALWLAVNLNGSLQMLGAALVMATAVCGMHYTGMAAMSHEYSADAGAHAMMHEGITPMTLGLFVFCASMVLLVLCLIAALSQLSNRMYAELDDESAKQPV